MTPTTKKIQTDGFDEREALLGVAIGMKGIGKTYETLKMIKGYVMGDAESQPRRVLILDVNNEFSMFKPIALSDIKDWCDNGRIEVRRITIYKAVKDATLTVNNKPVFYTPSGKMTLNDICGALFYILENFYNGLLLVEDITKIISDSLPNDLIGALCTQRHRGVDVILHFQTIGKAGNPKIIGNMNWLRIHKYTDKVVYHKNKFNEYTEPLSIAEILTNMKHTEAVMNRQAGKYKTKADFKKAASFHCFFDIEDNKLKGAFSPLDFSRACASYLRANYNSIVMPKLKEKSLLDNRPMYGSPKDVVRSLINNFFFEYYGNVA